MLLKYLFFALNLLLSVPAIAGVNDFFYMYDITDFSSVVPRNYRQVVPSQFFPSKTDYLSASGQFTTKQLEFLVRNAASLNRRLLVVDLRAERHLLINGLPVNVFPKDFHKNADFNHEELIGKTIKILKKDSKEFEEVKVESAYTEHEIAKKMGADYIKISVSDAFIPEEADLKVLKWLFKNFAKTHVIHIHCKAGRGRTTTILTIHSIMNYVKSHDLKRIIEYQNNLGGINLSVSEPAKKSDIFKELALERAFFIEDFYLKHLQLEKGK